MLCFTILECTSIRQNVVFWPRSPRTSNGDPFVVVRIFRDFKFLHAEKRLKLVDKLRASQNILFIFTG